MERWLAAEARAKPPPHKYSAEPFGLTEHGIRGAFADYMTRFIDPKSRS
jgi:hypothetical protein